MTWEVFLLTWFGSGVFAAFICWYTQSHFFCSWVDYPKCNNGHEPMCEATSKEGHNPNQLILLIYVLLGYITAASTIVIFLRLMYNKHPRTPEKVATDTKEWVEELKPKPKPPKHFSDELPRVGP